MDESSQIPPEIRENLVAYLDGELDDVATLEVERTLSESAEIRQEVEALARTWDLLDDLPRVRASSEFTERTMASVQALSSAQPTQPMFLNRLRRRLVPIGLVAGAVLCVVGGFLLTNQFVPDPSDPLVEDLPVIEQLDLYLDVGDAAFLQELHQSETLTEEPSPEVQNGDN